MCIYIESMIIGGLLFWGIFSAILAMGYGSTSNAAQTLQMVGIFGDVLTIAYYLSPLSTMLTIFRTGDASTLYFPTICANIANAFLWFFHGLLGVHQVVVWICSAVGLALGAIQIVLIAVFYKGTRNARALRKEKLPTSVDNTSHTELTDKQESNC